MDGCVLDGIDEAMERLLPQIAQLDFERGLEKSLYLREPRCPRYSQ